MFLKGFLIGLILTGVSRIIERGTMESIKKLAARNLWPAASGDNE